MKTYIGVRSSKGVEVFVVRMTREGAERSQLKHLIHHSPDGFEWGYGGSGPSDLALSILADFFNEDPTSAELKQGYSELSEGVKRYLSAENLIQATKIKCLEFHHRFCIDFVAGFAREGFSLPGELIRYWVETKERRK